MEEKKTTDALKILKDRYVKGDSNREASVREEKVNSAVASIIYELRKDAGLSQRDLAELVGTTQSVISRLEDADYDGHSLSMLSRIARALKQKLTVVMEADIPEAGLLQDAFCQFVQMLRKRQKLTVDMLASRLDVDRDELAALERGRRCRPNPLLIHKLSQFFGVPERRFLMLAGAIRDVPRDVTERASRFAAHSDSLAALTREEKRLLDEFVEFIKAEA